MFFVITVSLFDISFEYFVSFESFCIFFFASPRTCFVSLCFLSVVVLCNLVEVVCHFVSL